MTLRELRDVADAHIAADPAAADLEVINDIAGDPPIIGRAYYGKVHELASGRPCFMIVAQPIAWRFGSPNSPAALRAAAEKTEG